MYPAPVLALIHTGEGGILATAAPCITQEAVLTVLDHNTIVDAIIFGSLAVAFSLFGLSIFIVTRVIRSADRNDRRRYLLALLAVFIPPVLFAAVAETLIWIRQQSGIVIGSSDVRWLILANCLPAMVCAAFGAFVLPLANPRERGFSMIGAAVVGFGVYWMFAGRP